MEIAYNYKPYIIPKLGIFNVHTDEYKLPGGWVQKEEEIEIIGETDDDYIHRLFETEYEDCRKANYKQKYIMPLGIHKTRLLKWLPNQLKLF